MPQVSHLTDDCTCSGKRCTGCEKTLCVESFHRWNRSPDGRKATCKLCRKAQSQTEEFKAKRRERDHKNASHVNEKKRERYHSNPERERKRSKKYREENPEKVKAAQQRANSSERGKQRYRDYRARHPKKIKETLRQSRQKHYNRRIAEVRVYHANIRTLQTGAGGTLTVAEWEMLKAQYNYICPGCGRKEPEISLTVDHKTPVSKLGTSNIENIQPLCLSCNSRKGTKTINYQDEEKNCG